MLKKFIWAFVIMIGIVVVGIAGYAYYLYDSVKDTANDIHEPIDPEREKEQPKPKVDDKNAPQPISILLLGVDERENDQGRSDTMIVMTVNPEKKSMYMFNIPRDSRTEIIGKGIDDKINHAYAFGGTKMAVETVENFLDIPINYYIKVNMESFQDIVDAVGGVTVDNRLAFSDNGFSYPKGQIQLENGEKALTYVRMRKQDHRGDLGRNERQRQVIKGVIDKGARVSSISKFDNILDVISDNVKTNMTFSEMKDIQANYKDARKDLKTFEVDARGTNINGIFYFIVSEEERNSISERLKEHLEINSSNASTEEDAA
ncbi:LCP family protein [Pseudalkalibacillus berkeleyi]|uniref:Polyisoprenyl-teichoic acid--peptidoglycan teichoic acid transferase TagU n=1 Tax=Pseudalkalibacillus berkeleyi TaxID=1069813 RepID=A0ABS9H4I2_9BACL|nr:LCP family protein [Pseudalkalibacillus berkeleyi]MCF6138854.1 LCP family protein [Pseudalkalibacillus berkeleyi]